MKANELRELTPEELRQKYEDALKESFNLQMQKSAGQLEKPSRLRQLRRERARIQTIMNQRSVPVGA
jgi:large subunit ribosomal protein L29